MLVKPFAAAVSALIALASVVSAQTQQEVEPNDNPTQANAVTRGARVTGTYHWDGPRDPDYFAITVAAGDTIFVDVDANEFGSGLDPDIALLAGDGTTRLAANDQWDGVDAHLTYVATTTGTYYVRLDGFSDPPGPQPYTINFFEVQCSVGEDAEPNQSTTTAKTIAIPSTTRGASCPRGDVDYFKVTAQAGTKLVVQVDTVGRERPMYGSAWSIFAHARLLAADGTTELARVGEMDYPARIEYTVPATGTFYIAAGIEPGGIRYPFILRVSADDPPPPPPPPPPGSTVAESEPNDDPATADAAARGGKATGAIGNTTGPDPSHDRDWWAVTANAGDMIFVDVDGAEFGTGIEPSIGLYASDGTTLLAGNGRWDGADSYLEYRATTSGTYYVQIKHGMPAGTVPVSYTINFSQVTCPTGEDNEPNTGPANARTITVGTTVNGRTCPAGDVDYFKFDVAAGTKLVIQADTVGRNPPQPTFGCACGIWAVVVLYAPDGTTQLAHTTENEYPWRIEHTVTTAGPHYVSVSVWPGGIRYPYVLRVNANDPPPPPPPSTVTVAQAVTGLLRGTGLTAEQRTQLDTQGNQNGRYDVGDLRAYLVASGALTDSMRALLQRLEGTP